MKIFYKNQINEIATIIQNTAKYQKVMLLYDENVSNIKIQAIYEKIKENCIYNQCNINDIDDEIYNGYKLVIYICSTDNFLKCNLNREEFINIYCPQDNDMLLPYFLSNNNTFDCGKNYLFLESSSVDIQMVISIYFNRFYNYFKDILNCKNSFVDFSFDNKEITFDNIINYIETFDKDIVFLDIEIIKNCNMKYNDLAVINLMLINAFMVLITSIKSRSYMIVDVYKCAKDNEQLIDKLYRLYNNDSFENLMILNYNYLYNFCIKTKQKILDFLNMVEIDLVSIEEKINKLKDYSKASDDVLAYLYVYNIFNV